MTQFGEALVLVERLSKVLPKEIWHIQFKQTVVVQWRTDALPIGVD
jgi:hypothetical protein